MYADRSFVAVDPARRAVRGVSPLFRYLIVMLLLAALVVVAFPTVAARTVGRLPCWDRGATDDLTEAQPDLRLARHRGVA